MRERTDIKDPGKRKRNLDLLAEGKKRCSQCCLILCVDFFYKNLSKKDGLCTECKECMKKKEREYRLDPVRKVHLRRREKKSELKRKYQITLEYFDFLCEKYENCLICGKTFNIDFPACVDHDHKTGVVRGFLCASCNKGLGHFKESADVLERAIAYLNKHNNLVLSSNGTSNV